MIRLAYLIYLQHPSALIPLLLWVQLRLQTQPTLLAMLSVWLPREAWSNPGRTSLVLPQLVLRTAASHGSSTCMSPAKTFSQLHSESQKWKAAVSGVLKWLRSPTTFSKEPISLTEFLSESFLNLATDYCHTCLLTSLDEWHTIQTGKIPRAWESWKIIFSFCIRAEEEEKKSIMIVNINEYFHPLSISDNNPSYSDLKKHLAHAVSVSLVIVLGPGVKTAVSVHQNNLFILKEEQRKQKFLGIYLYL